MINGYPYFTCDNNVLKNAALIATGDMAGNCLLYQNGLLEKEEVCIMAGLDYNKPWTRDTAINTMNAFAIADKEVAYSTLRSVCCVENGVLRIGGQYWDCIIWAMGAYQYYMVNSDRDFLKFAHTVITNTLEIFEKEEFDADFGLFCGPAVYGDGVSAYPDSYGVMEGLPGGILEWPAKNPHKKRDVGYGIPMKALSTNCVYFAAYKIAAIMSQKLGVDWGSFEKKAADLKNAINKHFWNEKNKNYDYVFDGEIRCDRMEALGLSFAILTGVADDDKCEKVLKNTYVTDHGIACVWPAYDRYTKINERYKVSKTYDFGRHSGTIWPHGQGFWALANLKRDDKAGFEKELFTLAYKAVRDMQFLEIYHPITGEPYGGLQEHGANGMWLWKSRNKQTWSATAFWSMIYYGLFGLDFKEDHVSVTPLFPTGTTHMELKNLRIGNAVVNIVADKDSDAPHTVTIPKDLVGTHTFYVS